MSSSRWARRTPGTATRSQEVLTPCSSPARTRSRAQSPVPKGGSTSPASTRPRTTRGSRAPWRPVRMPLMRSPRERRPMADAAGPPPSRPPGPIDLHRYPFEPSYAGFQTFLKLPVCLTVDDLRAGQVDVAIGGIPWDGTSITRAGAHMAALAIRPGETLSTRSERSRPHLHVRVDPLQHLRVVDYGDAEVIPGNLAGTFDNVRRFVGDILQGGAIPILLGGDHA